MSIDGILVLAFGASLAALVLYGAWRAGVIGRSGRKVSSGVATWLGEIDHMLNPQRPSVEDIQHARDDDNDEDDDEGDPPEPGSPRKKSPLRRAEEVP